MRNETAVTARDRWLALGLLLGALALVYLVLVHPLWTRPMLAEQARIEALREREARASAALEQAPQVQLALEQARTELVARPGFLPQASTELATADLIQRLEALVEQVSPGNRSCAITNRSPLALPPGTEPSRFPRVAVQVRLRCGMPETAAVLHALEGGSPRVFVENLSIVGPQASMVNVSEAGGLDVSFDLYGYLAHAGAEVAHAP